MLEQTDIPNQKREMLHIHAKLLYLMLILALMNGRLSNAYSPQARGCNAASDAEEILNDLHIQNAAKRFSLRRQMGFDSFMKLENMKEDGPSDEPSKTTSATWKKQVKYQQVIRSLLSEEKEVAAGFVAFNADYKGPRHHPPKNN